MRDTDAALTVQTATGANGIAVTAGDTLVTGGDDTANTSLRLTGDGLEVLGTGPANLSVAGAVSANGLENRGAFVSEGETSLTSANGASNLSVRDTDAALTVQTATGANGIAVTAGDTLVTGGDDTANTSLRLTGDGLEVLGTGPANLSVAGAVSANGLENRGAFVNEGETSLTSANGASNLSVRDTDAALTVQTATGANGIAVTAGDTLVTGGDDTANTSLRLTGDGLEVLGTGPANLSVAGAVSANGLENRGAFVSEGETSLTSANGASNLSVRDTDAALTVQTATGANGIAVTAGDTLVTGGDDTANTSLRLTGDGLEVLGTGPANLSVAGAVSANGLESRGTLTVAGSTTTAGITNTGTLANTGTFTNTGTLNSVGNSTLTSADGTARIAVSDGRASLLVESEQGNAQYGIAVSRNGTTITSAPGSTVAIGVQNASGGTNGVTVTQTGTRIAGGTGTTYVDVTDAGVTITGTGPSKGDLNVQGSVNVGGNLKVAPGRTVDFGGNRLQNVGEGVADTDAVNRSQLDSVQDEARRGVAIAAALDTLLPDPDKRFRVNLGGGYFNGESAIGLTGAGRINRDVAAYFGIGTDSGFNETAGKIGISYQW